MQRIQHQVQFFMNNRRWRCETQVAAFELLGAKQLRNPIRRIRIPASREVVDSQFDDASLGFVELCPPEDYRRSVEPVFCLCSC
jgi:hypothetical protein